MSDKTSNIKKTTLEEVVSFVYRNEIKELSFFIKKNERKCLDVAVFRVLFHMCVDSLFSNNVSFFICKTELFVIGMKYKTETSKNKMLSLLSEVISLYRSLVFSHLHYIFPMTRQKTGLLSFLTIQTEKNIFQSTIKTILSLGKVLRCFVDYRKKTFGSIFVLSFVKTTLWALKDFIETQKPLFLIDEEKILNCFKCGNILIKTFPITPSLMDDVLKLTKEVVYFLDKKQIIQQSASKYLKTFYEKAFSCNNSLAVSISIEVMEKVMKDTIRFYYLLLNVIKNDYQRTNKYWSFLLTKHNPMDKEQGLIYVEISKHSLKVTTKQEEKLYKTGLTCLRSNDLNLQCNGLSILAGVSIVRKLDKNVLKDCLKKKELISFVLSVIEKTEKDFLKKEKTEYIITALENKKQNSFLEIMQFCSSFPKTIESEKVLPVLLTRKIDNQLFPIYLRTVSVLLCNSLNVRKEILSSCLDLLIDSVNSSKSKQQWNALIGLEKICSSYLESRIEKCLEACFIVSFECKNNKVLFSMLKLLSNLLEKTKRFDLKIKECCLNVSFIQMNEEKHKEYNLLLKEIKEKIYLRSEKPSGT